MWVWDWDDCYVPAQEEEGEEAKHIGTPEPPNNEDCQIFLFFDVAKTSSYIEKYAMVHIYKFIM